MAILRKLSKNSWTYICKAERPEYWEKRIADLETEIKELQDKIYAHPEEAKKSADDMEAKTEELKAVKKAAEDSQFLLDKFGGPTKYTLRSATKSEIQDSLPTDIKKAFINANEKKGISVETIQYTSAMNLHICKLGIVGWENMIEVDTDDIPDGELTPEQIKKYQVPFSRDGIERLGDGILKELADQIAGVVDIDTLKK